MFLQYAWFNNLVTLRAVLAAPQLVERAVGLRRQHLYEMTNGLRGVPECVIRDIEAAFDLPCGSLDTPQPLVIGRAESQRSAERAAWMSELLKRRSCLELSTALGIGFRTCSSLAARGQYVSPVIPRMMAELTGEELPARLAELAPGAHPLLVAFCRTPKPLSERSPRRSPSRWKRVLCSAEAQAICERGDVEAAKELFFAHDLDARSPAQVAFLQQTRLRSAAHLAGHRVARMQLELWIEELGREQRQRWERERLGLERYHAIRNIAFAQRPDRCVSHPMPATGSNALLTGSMRQGWWLDLGADGMLALTEAQRATLSQVEIGTGPRSYPNGVGVAQVGFGAEPPEWLLLVSNCAGDIQQARISPERLAEVIRQSAEFGPPRLPQAA